MRFVPSILVAGLFFCAPNAPLTAQDEPSEERLWKHTGQTRQGTLEVQRGPSLPADKAAEVDAATLEQLERRWQSLLTKKHHIPELKYDVAIDPELPPANPPTDLQGKGLSLNSFVFVKNTDPGTVIPAGFSATVNEPSVASAPDRVLFTGNWYATTSDDGGDTFSYINPFTSPNPPANDGFCCDQVTVYDPGTDAIFYLQQYLPDASNGTQRINVDAGADGTFDCFYNITPSLFGFGTGQFADFPDLAISDDHLFHSSNVFAIAGGFTGAFVARYPLDEIGTCNGSIPFDVYTDSSFFSFKLTRGASDIMYFADHISTASIRIWRWPEASTSPTPFDRAVTAWSNSPRTCPGPDGRDWCGFIDQRMAGAWVADGSVGFMWVPSQDATFPQPYTRIAQFSEPALGLVGEPIIWSGSVAFVYPSAAVNANGDVAGTIMAGSNSLHATCAAWIADDVNGDVFAPLENHVALTGTSGPIPNRSGDYNSTQPHGPNPYLWAGACFAYFSTGAGSPRFLVFGREGSLPIFEDGFESGNTSAW
ncbi:MAG: hypothetical protein MPN21_02285 [Thermoanaerobaculia bacterium]|nr:hypothetical protein [Thermoanaerobaculia bacterium]